MKNRCVTNNPLVLNSRFESTEFVKGNTLDVFKVVKKEILNGYKLVTHPLTGSLPPNVNPYKTVFLSSTRNNKIDQEGLTIIENSIDYTINLINNRPYLNWDKRSLEDFQFIDLNLIKNLL